nr:snaclec alboaggregin-A subunit alpha-like [Anolis sagrei ordinatus]
MGPVSYFELCLLGCLAFSLSVEGIPARNRSLSLDLPRCPSGALKYDDMCYEFHENALPWQDAENNCWRWRKGHLATIESAREEKLVSDYISREGNTQIAWIGLQGTASSSVSTSSSMCSGALAWARTRGSTKNLVMGLGQHERIETPCASADEMRFYTEHLIDFAKQGDTVSRWQGSALFR